jgi:hypothetical protein
MSRVQDAIGDALVAELASRTAWDERPEVLTVYYSGGRCRLGRLTVPDEIWHAAPPAEVLAGLAAASESPAADLLREVVPEGLHGMAFFTEIWMASAPTGTAAAEDLVKRARAAGGRVSTMPERVEARSIWAVDRAGISYTAFQVRGSDEVKRSVSCPKAGQPFTGAVPRALDRLVTAFLGVTLPDRGRA